MGHLITGITLTPLKIIRNDLGSVMHALKNDDICYHGFGEAYFSSLKNGVIKGWKKHTQMILNLVVPVGKIRFVIYDDRPTSTTMGKYFSINLSPIENYQRLTIQPGLWVAFEGLALGESLLLNIASIKHDPQEAENSPVDFGKIVYPKESNTK
jgi:dTDP-4-dehydrorhamnose 3,5-epimerase